MNSELYGLKLVSSHPSKRWRTNPKKSFFHQMTQGIRTDLTNLLCYVPVADGAPFNVVDAELGGFAEDEIESSFLLQSEHVTEVLLGTDFLPKFSQFMTFEYLALAAFSPDLTGLREKISSLTTMHEQAIYGPEGGLERLNAYRLKRDRFIRESAQLAFFCYDGMFALFYSRKPDWLSKIREEALRAEQEWGGLEILSCDFDDDDRVACF